MVDYLEQQKVLNGKFDIETHKKTFVDYLEVCIDKLGGVHYAIPSHQQFLMREYGKIHGITSDDAYCSMTRDLIKGQVNDGVDMMELMLDETGLLLVWTEYYEGCANNAQIETLLKLKEAGLFQGVI